MMTSASSRRHFRDRLQRFQVEDGDRGGLSVADKSAAEVCRDGYAMHAQSVFDFADNRARVHVEHFYWVPCET